MKKSIFKRAVSSAAAIALALANVVMQVNAEVKDVDLSGLTGYTLTNNVLKVCEDWGDEVVIAEDVNVSFQLDEQYSGDDMIAIQLAYVDGSWGWHHDYVDAVYSADETYKVTVPAGTYHMFQIAPSSEKDGAGDDLGSTCWQYDFKNVKATTGEEDGDSEPEESESEESKPEESKPEEGEPEEGKTELNWTYDKSEITLTAVNASGWGNPDNKIAVQTNVPVSVENVTTFADLKNTVITLSGIEFVGCEIEGVTAEKVFISLYIKGGTAADKYDVWKTDGLYLNMTTSSITWDLSTVTDVADDVVIHELGYQININGSDVAAINELDVDATVKFNVGEDSDDSEPEETTPEQGGAPIIMEPIVTNPPAATTPAEAETEPEATKPGSDSSDGSEVFDPNGSQPDASQPNVTDPDVEVPGTAIEDGTQTPGNVDGTGDGADKPVATGFAIAFIPAAAAAAMAVISKKRK